jgi:hypothetical protein
MSEKPKPCPRPSGDGWQKIPCAGCGVAMAWIRGGAYPGERHFHDECKRLYMDAKIYEAYEREKNRRAKKDKP